MNHGVVDGVALGADSPSRDVALRMAFLVRGPTCLERRTDSDGGSWRYRSIEGLISVVKALQLSSG
jgi:hypothetical protein